MNSAWSAIPEKVEKNRLDVGARAGDRSGQKCQLAESQGTQHGLINDVRIGSVVAQSAENRQKASEEELPFCQIHSLAMQVIREGFVPPHQEGSKPKQFQFFRALFAARQHPEIFHLPASRGLLEIHGVAKKSKVRLPQKCGHDAYEKKKQHPRRKKKNADCETRCGDPFLDQPAGHLNHHHAVGALHSRALHLVAKRRIFVPGEVQPGSVFHDPRADVPRVLVGEHAVAKVGQPRQNCPEAGQAKFQGHQPPEKSRKNPVLGS